MTASAAISRGRTQLSFTLPEGDSSQNIRTSKTSKTSKAPSRVTSNATLQETWNRLANTHLSQKLPSSVQSPDQSSSSVKFAGSIPGPPLLQAQKTFGDLQDDEAATVYDNEYLDLPDMLELEPLVEISFNDELCKEDLEGIYSKTKTSPFRYMDVMSCAELVDKLNDQNLNRGGDDIDPVDALDKMFPPRFTDFDGRKLLLQVSKMPANADQRKNLVAKFEALMTERFQSKQYTPDMIHLIEDTLDELIRQEVAENPTRGIILAHVRNCYSFVMHMLETLCDSSHLRAADSEHDFRQYTQAVNAQLVREEAEITNLNHRIKELHTAIKKQEVLHERERQELQAKYQTEVDHLRLECNNLKKQIDAAEEFDKALARNKSRNVDVSQSQDVVDETDRKESSPPEHRAMSVKFHGLHSVDVQSDHSHLRISRQQ